MPTYDITANKISPEKGAKSPEEENKCMCVWVCVSCVYQVSNCSVWMKADCEPVGPFTSLTLWIIGCSQSVLTSQWLSKKVKMEAEAVLAPRTRDRIRPEGEGEKTDTEVKPVEYFQYFPASLHVGIFLMLSVGKVTAGTKLKLIVGHFTDLTRHSRCICYTPSSRPVNRSIISPALAKNPSKRSHVTPVQISSLAPY